MIAWSITVVALAAVWLWYAKRSSPQVAVGAVLLLSCAIPTWCQLRIGDLPIDARMGAMIFALAAYCIHPKATFPWRLGIIDGAMICLLCVHVASDVQNSGWSWQIPFRMYGEWCIPYLAGRLAFHKLDTYSQLSPIGIAIGILFAANALVEAFFEVHPYEWLYGERFLDGVDRNAHRWGILRAWGPCGHAIYFSLVQLLLWPWLLNFFWTRLSTRDAYWAWLLPAAAIVGIACTGSRGTLLGIFIASLWSVIVLVPRTRLPIIATGSIVVLMGMLNYQLLLDWAHRWGGEQIDFRANPTAVVDDEKVQVTSVLSRIYILRVYRRAVVRAGLLGFGTEAVTGFPISVPVGPEDATALKQIRFIDNEYLLLALRFGWVGCSCFAIALAAAVIAWTKRTAYCRFPEKSWCAFNSALVLACACCLATVWMPHDIGFPLLALMGGTAASFRPY